MKRDALVQKAGNKKISKEALRPLPLFSELSPLQLEEIISIARPVNCKKNQIIFSEGEIYSGFYILLKGSIKVFKLSAGGKESILHLIKPSDSFGDLPLFEGGDYPVNAQAITDSNLIFFPKKEFLLLLSRNNQISLNMLAGFAKRLRGLTRKIEELTTNEVMNRFAYYLVDEIKKGGTEKLPEPYLKLSISKKNVAFYIGTVTETFSRVLKKMQEEKIIRVEGKIIYAVNYPRLKALITK